MNSWGSCSKVKKQNSPGTPRSTASLVDPIPPWVMKRTRFLWPDQGILYTYTYKFVPRMSPWGIHFVMTRLSILTASFANESSRSSYFHMKVISGKRAIAWNMLIFTTTKNLKNCIEVADIRVLTRRMPCLLFSGSCVLLAIEPNDNRIARSLRVSTPSQCCEQDIIVKIILRNV